MYKNVYEAMVTAGVAEKIDSPVESPSGSLFHYNLTHPEHLFVDGTGCNTNQLNDGKVGGEFIMPKADPESGTPVGDTTDLHFTVLPFVSGTGDAVMCAIVFKSEQQVSEIPLSQKLGSDITVTDLEDKKLVMSGGPTCSYNGKIIPPFFGTSAKISITSQLLVDMLKFIDQCGIHDRSIATPFLLLDGHHSRLMLPFIRYINDENRKWCCCIGIPYATHICQVGDASSLIGTLKMELYQAKHEYIKH